MSEITLRDTIADALDNYEAPADDTPAVEERARDEHGRFASKTQETAPEATETALEAAPEVAPEPKKVPRPSSWKKDYEQDWEVLPDRIREYITEREGQYAKGVSTYKNQWDQAAPIYEAVSPYLQEWQQYGVQPGQLIANLANAHRTLALGSPDQKLQMFAQLANQYGVPLQQLVGGNVDPQFSLMAQQLNQLQQQWQGFQTQQQQAEQAQAQSAIESFRQNAPFFEEVREDMAKLLQSGYASGLQEAYDKAIRLNDQTWQRQQAEQAKAAQAEQARVIAEKKAKAVSTRSASPTGAMNASGNGKKSLRDALSDAIDAAGAFV